MVFEMVRLLLIEDNPADVFLMEAALETSVMSIGLSIARDGVEAMEHLAKAHSRRLLPHLIMLDLNMPRMDGFEVLAALHADVTLAHLPVMIFTTSTAMKDVKRAYALHADSYVSKPATMNEFLDLVRLLGDYWSGTAKLPSTYSL